MSTTPTIDEGPAKTPKKAALASWIGSVLEYYDFFIYGTAAALVFGKVFFPESDPATGTLLSFATYGVGYVARPIGAFFMGHIGDKYGRKRVLILTVTMMGVSTFLVGCLPVLRLDRAVGAGAARGPAPDAGLLGLGRAGQRELAHARARARAPARVLLELHARRHAGGPHHRHRRLPADRHPAGRSAPDLGLAHPVLAERLRGARGRADPAPAGGDPGLPGRGEGRRHRQDPGGRAVERPPRRRPARGARGDGVDGQHDLRRLRAQLRRRHQGAGPDDDAVGLDRHQRGRAGRAAGVGDARRTASGASRCSSSARSAAAR